MKKVIAWVDGSYNKPIETAGSGVFITDDAGLKIASFYKGVYASEETSSWNIVGELMAVWIAVDWAISHNIPEIEIKHDLQGIPFWFNQQWKTNVELTCSFKEWAKNILDEGKITVTFTKVKAHSGIYGNDQADKLAKIGAKVISL